MSSPDARRALLDRLIDHAPTFPPAALPAAEALADDERALGSPHSFALARLVWAASRLDEMPDTGRALSVVLDAPLPVGVHPASVEARYRDDLDELEGLAEEVYVEVPIDASLEAMLDAVVERAMRVKVRCGGAVVPRDDELAGIVRACRERGLVFKATAGLHHAVRTNGGHGFLNLLGAAVFSGDEDALLAETDAAAFTLDAGAFAWRDRRADAAELERVRRDLFHSIGSCSFFEPIAALEDLRMLPG